MEGLHSYLPIGVIMSNLETGEATVVWSCDLSEFEPMLCYDVMSEVLFEVETEFEAAKERYDKKFKKK